jgi:hypothetical protein
MEFTRFVTFLGDKAAPSTIRVMLPYMLLNYHYTDMIANYDFIIHKDPVFYKYIKVLQFQHQNTKQQLELIEYVKSLKQDFKLFYDTDDLFLDVPDYNVNKQNIQIQNIYMKKILETVDYIICSTPDLARHLSKYNKTKIIKNRLIRSLWEKDKTIEINNKPKILWAGSPHHFSLKDNDGDFSEDIVDFILKTTDKYEWIFIGSLPLKLINNKNITFYKWLNYFDYVQLLKTLNPDIGIALLKDNDFNKCKSNIKALEYTAINIPGIYSNISPYKDMTCKVNNTDEFIGYIEKLTTNYDYRQDVKMKDYKTLKDNLYWDDLYIKRYLNTYLER